MQIKISFDKDFDELWKSLQKKYPQKLFDLDGVGKQLDFANYSKDFFCNKNATADISVDSNSNVSDKSVVAYDVESFKPMKRLNSYYMLWKFVRKYFHADLADKIVEMHLKGDIYINDYHDFFIRPYCFNYSTMDIAMNGLPYIDRINCVPPKYMLTFKQQLEQFTAFASNNQSGASGQADLLIIVSYYVKKIILTLKDCSFQFKDEENAWNYVREILTSYIYTINQPFRSNQSAFTNISLFDDVFLENLCGDIYFIDGSQPDKNIIKKLQEMFIDIMNKELERTPITFPVVTACFSVDENNKILDDDFLKLIAEKNTKWGFVNIYSGSSSTLSSCCRLRSEINNEYFNSFGAGSTKIGSLGVVTLNLAKAGKQSKNEDDLLDKIGYLTEIACKINKAKRNILEQRIESGSLPLYTHGYMDINKQYLTTGVNGLNECLYFMGKDVLSKDGQDLQLKIIHKINEVNEKMSKRYKCPINCEQTPSENSAIKLANKDKMLKVQNEFDIYSNQFIPLIANADLLDRINLQGKFDKHFSGGAIAHLNVENKISEENMGKLIEESINKGVVYFAVNYNLQQCEDSHMSIGRNKKCSICSKEIVNNYLRVVGFLTNTKNWHKTRREFDYPKRVFYDEIS